MIQRNQGNDSNGLQNTDSSKKSLESGIISYHFPEAQHVLVKSGHASDKNHGIEPGMRF
jgi:hypothetical protein